MKYLKQTLLIFVLVLFGIVIYFSASLGLTSLFIFPILIISGYIIYYLHKQFEEDNKKQLEQSVKYAIEDIEAAEWIKNSLIPQTIAKARRKHWTLIIYSFIFAAGIYFLWSYLNADLLTAIRDLILACILFWLLIYYIYSAPFIFNWFIRFLPGKIKKYNFGDWGRAYFFLLPVSIIIYLLYPIESLLKDLAGKLVSIPIFFLIYTFSFLSLYSMMYIYKDMQKEEKKQLEKEIKDLL